MALALWDTSNLSVNWDNATGFPTCDCCGAGTCATCDEPQASYSITISGVTNCSPCLAAGNNGWDFTALDYASYINGTHTFTEVVSCTWRKDLDLGNEEILECFEDLTCSCVSPTTHNATGCRMQFSRGTGETLFTVSLEINDDDVFSRFPSTAVRDVFDNECISDGSFTSQPDCSSGSAIVDFSSIDWTVN